MNEEQRENIKRANKRRAAHICQKCHAEPVMERDGSEVGGLAGIKYRCCNACGWAVAITHRPKKFKLR